MTTATLPQGDSPTLVADVDRMIAAELAAPIRITDEDIAREFGDDGLGDRAAVKLNPTQWAFVHCDADVILLRGNRRAGKTTSAVARLLRLAATYPEARPIKVACVRDTWTNLERTVLETIRQGAAAGWWDVRFLESETQCVLNDGDVHIYFFGMERAPDANKFQSFEIGVLWIEEPAPAADLASGVPIEVFALGVTSLSQKGMKPSVQITSNPSDSTHWTARLLDELRERDLDALKVMVFDVPKYENVRNQPVGYLDRMAIILHAAGRDDLVERLVEGRVGMVTLGVAVTPDFAEELHMANEVIVLNPRWESFRSFDFGGSPACCLAQRSPSGHLFVIGALVTPEGVTMGIEQFIQQILIPWQVRFGIRTQHGSDRERARALFRFRDMGDPAGRSPEGSNSERTAARSLEALLRTEFEPAPVAWAPRRDSMAYVLRQSVGRKRMVQIDPDECEPLKIALKGGFHYHKSASGIVSDRPIKNHSSHIGDAFGYLCAELYPVAETLEKLASGLDVAPAPRPSRDVPWFLK